MNVLLLIVAAVILLVGGYVLYGGWLARKWGASPERPTPAREFEDGQDYVCAPAHVLMGHHFSSIAGIGFIGGPILAAVFGWVPVFLWVIIGGIIFGAAQGFGSLLASVRNKGATLATVIRRYADERAKNLFCVFALITTVLLIGVLLSIVADAFAVASSQTDAENARNMTVAQTSILFVVAALGWGFATHNRIVPVPLSILVAFVVVVALVGAGVNIPGVIALSREAWMVILGVYVFAASVVPVWMLLQPRDYLSSFLLFGMILIACVGVIGAGVVGAASELDIPAFTGFVADSAVHDYKTGAVALDDAGNVLMNGAAQGGFLFPTLFIIVGSGVASGFHGLVSSGTTAKQIQSESHARPVAFGSALIGCMLAILALCAVGFVWPEYVAGEYASPMQVFADGLSGMLACIPGLEGTREVAYTLMALAVAAFCLTSLDTAVRIARYLFQELWTPLETNIADVVGWRATLCNKYAASLIVVVAGVCLGLVDGLDVWPLLGTANQLLATLALLGVCCWLGNAGKDNKMLRVPMWILLAISGISFLLIMQQKVAILIAGTDAVSASLQLAVAIVLFIIGIAIMVKGKAAMRGAAQVRRKASSAK